MRRVNPAEKSNSFGDLASALPAIERRTFAVSTDISQTHSKQQHYTRHLESHNQALHPVHSACSKKMTKKGGNDDLEIGMDRVAQNHSNTSKAS